MYELFLHLCCFEMCDLFPVLCLYCCLAREFHKLLWKKNLLSVKRMLKKGGLNLMAAFPVFQALQFHIFFPYCPNTLFISLESAFLVSCSTAASTQACNPERRHEKEKKKKLDDLHIPSTDFLSVWFGLPQATFALHYWMCSNKGALVSSPFELCFLNIRLYCLEYLKPPNCWLDEKHTSSFVHAILESKSWFLWLQPSSHFYFSVTADVKICIDFREISIKTLHFWECHPRFLKTLIRIFIISLEMWEFCSEIGRLGWLLTHSQRYPTGHASQGSWIILSIANNFSVKVFSLYFKCKIQ